MSFFFKFYYDEDYLTDVTYIFWAVLVYHNIDCGGARHCVWSECCFLTV